MKKNQLFAGIPMFIFLSLFFLALSCRKQETVTDEPTAIPTEIISSLQKQGYGTKGIARATGGYVVEGDIYLSEEKIRQGSTASLIRVANTEQYRTFYTVGGPLPRTITVSTSNLNANYVAAVDAAIARYNSINPALCLQFQRIPGAGTGDIDILDANLVPGGHPDYIPSSNTQTWGRSGSPNYTSPWYAVGINVAMVDPVFNIDFVTTLIAHEIGHCIGLRHTDFFNRAFSCFSDPTDPDNNEHQENSGIGAYNIPGTPTTEDANSWMLACIGPFDDRPFTANDQIALRWLYGCSATVPSYTIQTNPCNGIYSTASLFGNVGDVVTLQLSFGGYVNWNGMNNGAGGSISLGGGGQSNYASSQHYYGSGGFNLSCNITFTMTSNNMPINTTAVVNNSTSMFSSTATLTVVSVNGNPVGNQGVVCGGNSGGSW